MAEPLTPGRLAELRAIESRMEPAEWRDAGPDNFGDDWGWSHVLESDDSNVLLLVPTQEHDYRPGNAVCDQARANAAGIAALRNAASALLDAAEEAGRLRAACEAALESLESSAESNEPGSKAAARVVEQIRAALAPKGAP